MENKANKQTKKGQVKAKTINLTTDLENVLLTAMQSSIVYVLWTWPCGLLKGSGGLLWSQAMPSALVTASLPFAFFVIYQGLYHLLPDATARIKCDTSHGVAGPSSVVWICLCSWGSALSPEKEKQKAVLQLRATRVGTMNTSFHGFTSIGDRQYIPRKKFITIAAPQVCILSLYSQVLYVPWRWRRIQKRQQKTLSLSSGIGSEIFLRIPIRFQCQSFPPC